MAFKTSINAWYVNLFSQNHMENKSDNGRIRTLPIAVIKQINFSKKKKDAFDRCAATLSVQWTLSRGFLSVVNQHQFIDGLAQNRRKSPPNPWRPSSLARHEDLLISLYHRYNYQCVTSTDHCFLYNSFYSIPVSTLATWMNFDWCTRRMSLATSSS